MVEIILCVWLDSWCNMVFVLVVLVGLLKILLFSIILVLLFSIMVCGLVVVVRLVSVLLWVMWFM